MKKKTKSTTAGQRPPLRLIAGSANPVAAARADHKKQCQMCGDVILATQKVHPIAQVHMDCAIGYDDYWNEREKEMRRRAGDDDGPGAA